MMGFITCLNDILIPHLKAIFDLSYVQAMLVQFCFFTAYAVMSIPMGKLVGKIGYKGGVIGGFLLTAVGCLLFYPAADSASYPTFLAALFILASGVTLLQVAGNPYVTLLSRPGKESSTLTLVQAFNSLGTTVAPWFGSMLILADAGQTASKAEQISSVQIPYLGLAGVLILLAVFVKMIKLPDARKIAEEVTEHSHDGKTSVWQYKHLILGALGIFCYVGAEVSIGSLLVSVMEVTAGLDHATGARLLSVYWGGAMVGRFLGALLMQRIAPSKYLAFNNGGGRADCGCHPVRRRESVDVGVAVYRFFQLDYVPDHLLAGYQRFGQIYRSGFRYYLYRHRRWCHRAGNAGFLCRPYRPAVIVLRFRTVLPVYPVLCGERA